MSTGEKSKESVQQRLRQLKQKMNQARHLNRQAVQEEGEAIGGIKKKYKKKETQESSDALNTAVKTGIDEKFLVQQADEAIYKKEKKEEQKALNQYRINDYHNPQGQYRNYLRNLKALPKDQRPNEEQDRDLKQVYDPLQNEANEKQQKEGAHRLASEIHRRMEKRKKRQRDTHDEQEGINKQNKLYNKRVSRDYDQHTKEIKQNLERGTAL